MSSWSNSIFLKSGNVTTVQKVELSFQQKGGQLTDKRLSPSRVSRFLVARCQKDFLNSTWAFLCTKFSENWFFGTSSHYDSIWRPAILKELKILLGTKYANMWQHVLIKNSLKSSNFLIAICKPKLSFCSTICLKYSLIGLISSNIEKKILEVTNRMSILSTFSMLLYP